MAPKRKQAIHVISSDDDDRAPFASHKGQRAQNNKGCRKATPQKRARQGQLTFRSSQEEKRGALPLSLSQSTDAKAASKKQSQSTLQFQPISRDEAAALSCSQAEMPTDRQDASKGSFRGFGSGSQEQKAPEQSDSQCSWLAKHVPDSVDSLAMHKKKVEELRGWLELQKQPGLGCQAPRMLILSGPTGCGKSTALQVLAKELGFVLCEWQPPVPTLWHEHRYQSDGGTAYSSKLDDFEAFVARSKLAALQLQPSRAQHSAAMQQELPSQASQSQADKHVSRQVQQKLTMVDDLPHVGDPEQRRRLTELLVQLARSSRFPIVVIVTGSHAQSGGSFGGASKAGSFQGWHRDMQAALEAVGVAHISCNPVTANNAAKALLRVAEAERMPLAKEQAHSLAEAANGDLRNALEMLQLLSVGQDPTQAAPKTQKRKAKKPKLGGAGMKMPDLALERDIMLDSFHAIGKFLYNKREISSSQGQQSQASAEVPLPWRLAGDSYSLAEAATSQREPLHVSARHQRPPMPFDPEVIWQQSQLDFNTTAGFLHENCLHFLEDAAIEDAALEAEFFSDSDWLSSRSYTSGTSGAFLDAELGAASSVMQAMAASVLLRGLLFASVHQAPRRWLPLRKSAWGVAQQGIAANLAQLRRLIWAKTGSSAGGSTQAFAASVLPCVRSMAAQGWAPAAALMPEQWTQLWQGQLSEESYRPAGLHGIQEHAMGSAEHSEHFEQDEELIEE
ncbi:g9794 [Coccomyxa viridis]|uniref:G9794 protein n=1 Tax=Coccomyxa viridis TaxID=1274662 RepID=A0ABP1G463_9CHLO